MYYLFVLNSCPTAKPLLFLTATKAKNRRPRGIFSSRKPSVILPSIPDRQRRRRREIREGDFSSAIRAICDAPSQIAVCEK